MNKLVLFCVESNAQADTDYQYIRETIKHFYKDNKKIVLRPIHLNSKTRYQNSAVIKRIEKLKQSFPNNNVSVIYCIDVDDYDTSAETKELLESIKRYCARNRYDFVFFCRDIEDVYWGKQVNKNEKVRYAANYVAQKKIKTIKESQLRKTRYAKNGSNILNVLDKHL